MADIVDFTGTTLADLQPDAVLEGAVGELKTVVVFGYDKHGGEYFASSGGGVAEISWLIERLKRNLHAQIDEAIDHGSD